MESSGDLGQNCFLHTIQFFGGGYVHILAYYEPEFQFK